MSQRILRLFACVALASVAAVPALASTKEDLSRDKRAFGSIAATYPYSYLAAHYHPPYYHVALPYHRTYLSPDPIIPAAAAPVDTISTAASSPPVTVAPPPAQQTATFGLPASSAATAYPSYVDPYDHIPAASSDYPLSLLDHYHHHHHHHLLHHDDHHHDFVFDHHDHLPTYVHRRRR